MQLSAVSIAAPGEVWAVGSASDGTGEVRPLVAHGTAGRWQLTVIKSLAPAWGELTTVLALSPLDVWVGGRDEGTPDSVHIWPLLGHWTGRAWRWDTSVDHDSWTLTALVGGTSAGLWALGGSGQCSDPNGSCNLVLIRRVGANWVDEGTLGPGVPVAAVGGPPGGRPVILGRAVTPAEAPPASIRCRLSRPSGDVRSAAATSGRYLAFKATQSRPFHCVNAYCWDKTSTRPSKAAVIGSVERSDVPAAGASSTTGVLGYGLPAKSGGPVDQWRA